MVEMSWGRIFRGISRFDKLEFTLPQLSKYFHPFNSGW